MHGRTHAHTHRQEKRPPFRPPPPPPPSPPAMSAAEDAHTRARAAPEVSVPLLQDDGNDELARQPHASSSRPRRDVRFAISEDDVPDADDDDDEDDRDHLIAGSHSSNSDKYPPLPTSLPPSYRDAVYKKDPWYKSEVALSLQHYGLICFSGVGTFFRRYWPTSRFAQAGFFIVGLWIIVIVTGPTWDKSARLGWGKSVDDFLASIPPPPISGDGHFTSLADWSMPSCRSIPSGLSTYCSRSSTYMLPIPHEKDAFMTSDKIFLFIDPLRKHLSEDRGAVPSSVRVKMDGTVKGQVKVVVKAHYEKEMEPLLERANVGMMKSGLVDQGVGIYTWPLPPRLAELTTRDPDQFPYPLLSFDVTIHVEPHSEIPNFLVEGARADVGFFTDAQPTAPLPAHRRDVPIQEMQMSNATREKLSHARFGHAIGLAKQAQEQERRAAEQPHAFFGSIVLKTGHGNLALAGKTLIMGHVVLKTNRGDVALAETTDLRASSIYLESQAGDIGLASKAQLETRDVLSVIARNGSIHADDGVRLKGTRVNGEAHAGSLDAKAAQWTSNHTLVLSARDDVVTQAGIEPPWRPALGTGTEQHAWVSVDATSDQGRVEVSFPEHIRTTPLRAKFTSNSDSSIALHPEYVGSFSVHGQQQQRSSSSRVTPPREHTSAAQGSDVDRKRVFSLKDKSSEKDGFVAEGEVWWQSSQQSTKPKGEDWGSVVIKAKSGAVALGFDAV